MCSADMTEQASGDHIVLVSKVSLLDACRATIIAYHTNKTQPEYYIGDEGNVTKYRQINKEDKKATTRSTSTDHVICDSKSYVRIFHMRKCPATRRSNWQFDCMYLTRQVTSWIPKENVHCCYA